MSTASGTCGCFGQFDPDPRDAVFNDPGKAALSYRIGAYGSFRRAMLSGLARPAFLPQFTTRDQDDPTAAMVSAWAAALDVLSFYQERIANEAFLRTATERRSVLELARSIGYELSPGVAASVYMAFTVDTAAGAPTEVRLDVGTQVQSQPDQDETPQIFETVEQIVAKPALNALHARTRRLRLPEFGDRSLALEGQDTRLKPGDGILIVGRERQQDAGSERWDFRRIDTVDVDDDHDLTVVTWREGLGTAYFGRFILPAADHPQVFALRTRANLFGYNAPSLKTMIHVANALSTATTKPTETEWPNLTITYTDTVPDNADTIHLDGALPQVVAGGWVVLSRPGYAEAYSVVESVEDSITQFTLSGRTTRLKLKGENLKDKFGAELRQTQVFAESIELPIGQEIITESVQGVSIVLSDFVEGLEVGRHIGLVGVSAGTGLPFTGEFEIADLSETDGLTTLILTESVPPLLPESVVINANVALATHGQSTAETLGSGNASVPGQTFTLKKKPLTYIPTDVAPGSASTLQVRVNDSLWKEVPTLFGASAKDRVYTVRLRDDGTSVLTFGDGTRGARLPTGIDNIKATYRSGIGLQGIVDAGQIKLLLSRPLGLKDAVNPAPSEAAADPEQLEDARENAPLKVLTMERVVSLQDYEDFARSFSGIYKALAGWVWNGEDQVVHLTVAGQNGKAVGPLSDLGRRLRSAIDSARHPDHSITLASFEGFTFVVDASVLPDPERVPEDVLEAAKRAVVEAFSFDSRELACPVALSDVMAALQNTSGVVAAQVNKLYLLGKTPSRQERLPALQVRLVNDEVRPAQLLITDAVHVTVLEMLP